MTVVDLLPFALLGGVLGLDVVSFPQAMFSRPLVAATLAGALAGSAVDGLLVGAVLELISLETLPVGASRYPEWGSASVVAGVLFAGFPAEPAGALMVAVAGALCTAAVGGWTMVLLRRLNAAWAARHRSALEAGSPKTVIGLQLFGLTADLMRALLLTFIALLVLVPIAHAVLPRWSLGPRLSRSVVVGCAAAVAGAACWKLFHSTHGARWYFLGGLAAGLVVFALR